MLGTQIDRALYVAICKDDDRIWTEQISFNAPVANSLVERGKRIALSERMPEPLSADPSWYQCKFCPAHEFCHKTHITKEVNCRTCAHSTATPDSEFTCSRHGNTAVPVEFQRTGCEGHVLHPDLVPWQRKDGPDDYTAVYEINGTNVANGDPEQEGVFSSRELLANAAACADKGWTQLHDMRKQFGGRVVG